MAKTVVASFDSFEDARRVVDDLEAQGFPSGDINLIASQPASGAAARGARTDSPRAPATDLQGEPDGLRGVSDRETTGSSVATGAVTGGVVGGAAGLLASLAGIAVPGVGPLLAAGPIVAALTGAGVGAVAGGLIGAAGGAIIGSATSPYRDGYYYEDACPYGYYRDRYGRLYCR